jgi:ABC-type Mn2+/Zn2+ transport system ATPase subunit
MEGPVAWAALFARLTACLRLGHYLAVLVRLERVSFRYHRRAPWVLQDVTLLLSPGQVIEVTGRNGAGKSTFLRLVAGLCTPRRGSITGRPGRIGYAPERFPSDQPFTVRGYLTHMAAMQRAPRTAIDTWAERLAFSHLLETRLPELSKGSAQKVGVAQALLASPDLLILDEPFAGLDATTRDTLPDLISELASQGTIVVVSDHQRCLAPLPDISRIQIADRTATLVSAPTEPPAQTFTPNSSHSRDAEPGSSNTGNRSTAGAPGDPGRDSNPGRNDDPRRDSKASRDDGSGRDSETGQDVDARRDGEAGTRRSAPNHGRGAGRTIDARAQPPGSAHGGAKRTPPDSGTVADGPWRVVEVVVRADELDEVVSKLRADGLEVREPKR